MNRFAKVLVAALALTIALPAGATSVTTVKITRIRRAATSGDVFVQVSVPPSTLDCASTFAVNETYVFDGDTSTGRILDALLLAAYSANKFVDIAGTGTCRVYGVSPFFSRFENVQSATIR